MSVQLLENFLGCADSEQIANLAEAIANNDAAAALEGIDALINTGLSEVQIAEAVIDYMRDLMVVSTSGINTSLMIANAEQKKRAQQIAENFDTPGLIYNITVLEKAVWGLKNNDKPRPLLEASMLRLALSEHFLNVSDLASGKNTRKSLPVKKTLNHPRR